MYKFENKKKEKNIKAYYPIVIAGVIVALSIVGIFSCIALYYPDGEAENSTPATIDEVVSTIDEVTEVVETTTAVTEPIETEPTTVTEPATEEVVEETYENKVDVKGEFNQPTQGSSSAYDTYTRDLLAKVIYLEAGVCGEECQRLVGSTAMNLADARGGLANVAYDYNTFNIAYRIDGCVPSETSIRVAERVLSGDRDYNVKAFRTSYYHSFGTPYTNIDNVYFSTY